MALLGGGGLAVKAATQVKPDAALASLTPTTIAGVGEGAKAVQNPLAASVGASDPSQVTEAQYNAARPVQGGVGGMAGDIIAEAKKWIGTPYKWGQSGPLGFDCSGFVQYVYKQMGINLPRVSYQQANAGTYVDAKDARPGDLISWDNSARNNGADHIAIYLGNGQIIAAPKPGDHVKIQAIYGNYRVTRIAGVN